DAGGTGLRLPHAVGAVGIAMDIGAVAGELHEAVAAIPAIARGARHARGVPVRGDTPTGGIVVVRDARAGQQPVVAAVDERGWRAGIAGGDAIAGRVVGEARARRHGAACVAGLRDHARQRIVGVVDARAVGTVDAQDVAGGIARVRRLRDQRAARRAIGD